MGYYSQVTIQLEKNAFDMVMNSIEEFNRLYLSTDKYKFGPDCIFGKDNECVLQWNSIKWCDWYDDIKSVTKVLEELDKIPDDRLDGHRYEFLRVGESEGDIEHFANDNGYGSCYVETQIHIDDRFSLIDE